MYEYPIGTLFYVNCPYNRSFSSSGRSAADFPSITELNSQLNPSYTCPRYSYYYNTYPSLLRLNDTEMNLRNDIRKLWEQHGAWTRMTIMSIVFDLPDVDFATKRLLKNPTDFANALKPFYGTNIALKFGNLLKDHLVIAAELVKAAKAGNNQAAAQAEKRWYANADEIATLLGKINPYWSREKWKEMLHEHLSLVKSEAVNMLTKNFAAGITTYDEIENQALEMADEMVHGIIKQFPNKFNLTNKKK